MTGVPQLVASKMITCILPRGDAQSLMTQLYEQYHFEAVESYSGRGQDSRIDGLEEWREKDILNLIVPATQADEAFALLYDLAQVGEVPGRFIFQVDNGLSTQFELPKIEADSAETSL